MDSIGALPLQNDRLPNDRYPQSTYTTLHKEIPERGPG